MTAKRKIKAFLSHASVDKKIVRRLASDLIAHNVEVWLDEQRIQPGHSIPDEIQKGLDASDYLLLFLTPRAVESGWVKQEWETKFVEQVARKRISVIPLLIERCIIPAFLKPIKYADFTLEYEEGFSSLLGCLTSGDDENEVQSTNVYDTVADILDGLSKEAVTIPFAGKIPIVQTLKRLPRSGKHLRLENLTVGKRRRIPRRSLYDHILSVAHSADCLFKSVDHGLFEKDIPDLSRCVAYHEINEVLLGDIPSYTN